MVAAPVMTPPKPLGMKGVQLPGLTWPSIRAMNRSKTSTLRMTNRVLTFALSLIPRMSRVMTARAITKAGTFMMAPGTTPGALTKAVGK
ncbi:hypothetical protein D3C86_1141760 [compost metagenome]